MPHTLEEEEEEISGLVERTTDLSSFVGVICLFLPAATADSDCAVCKSLDSSYFAWSYLCYYQMSYRMKKVLLQ